MQGDGGRRVLLVSLPTSLPPPYCRIFLCGMNANQLSICRFFFGFDCFRLVRQCKVAEGDEPPPYCRIFLCGMHANQLSICRPFFLGFDYFRLVRQCKGAEGDEPPPYYWCNFEGQHIRGKDIVVIEFVSFSNSFGKSMILR